MHPAFVTPIPLSSLTNRRRARTPCTPCRPRQFAVRASSDQDHYKVLNVPETADAQTVKRAYRRAALKNHPDVSDAPDARDRFLRVQEAYAILSDPSKRAAYDRRKASPFGSSPSGFPGFDGFDGFNGFDNDFAKKWRDKNPMPEDIDDSLGSIFGDLFSGIADAVGGSNGVVEDFVEFLEKGVGGFRDDGLSEILATRDIDVLETELEDARFVLKQLKSRKVRAEDEAASLRERASQWRARAQRAEARRDYDVRIAAEESERELMKEAERFKERARKTARLMTDQEERVRKISERRDQVRQEQPSGESKVTTTEKSSNVKGNQKEAIDDEIEKMKREMGI